MVHAPQSRNAAAPMVSPAPGQVAPPAESERIAVHTAPPRGVLRGEPSPRWWWLGVHGGAGVSTLSGLIPGGWDAARAWPDPRIGGPPGLVGVMLVCRSHQAGMSAASAAIRQWASGRTPPVQLWGLVIVADAPGRLPRPLKSQQKRLVGTVSRCVVVPWVEAWRTAAPSRDTAPSEIAALETQLTS
ncbi:DUF6668 family protein [Actinopolyspora halophila]|uniref:DUF6668 family protein n=1 Tax=Actinopolyspora halophila TaxID=1850 RepID=UPI0003697F8A|nr:DUF6668 family protein [Actinopolyspora halophila]